MKQLVIVTHTRFQQAILDELQSLKFISGYTITHVEGHGTEYENDPFASAREKSLGYTNRLKLDIVLDPEDIDSLIETLRKKIKDIKDHGVYWTTPVEAAGRL